MNIIRHSLGIKVLVLTSLLTIAGFTGLFIYNTLSEYSTMLEEVEITAGRNADMLKMAIEEPMSQGDNEGTTIMFQVMSSRHDGIDVYMVDYKGEISYSTDESTIRTNLVEDCPSEDCRDVLERSLTESIEEGLLVRINGVPRFVEVMSIENDQSCHHCHGKSRDILGAMVVDQDVSRQFSALRSQQFKAAGISLFGVLAVLGALLYFMKISVVNKIRTIAGATEAVTAGDLDAKFEVSGHDELFRLGHHLSDMVARIKNQLQYNKSVLSGIIVPMFVTDSQERVEFVNSPLSTILGKDDDVVHGTSIMKVFNNDPQLSNVGTVISMGEAVNGNMRYMRDDGVEFPLHYEISPLRDADGKVVGAIGVMIDLTQEEQDRKNIEAQQRNLLVVANKVTEVAMALETASDELSGQMDKLTAGVDNTADETSRVATAMEEMNATVLEVARNASETSEASIEANRVAKDGGVVVQNTVIEITEVAKTSQSLAGTLNELAQRAENIGVVMAVINDIADQTNLLALNAAIEAARAGEAGRGFAVVADEVRKLAEKTMQATKEVEDAISLIQDSTKTVVNEMESTQESVVRTADMAKEAGGVLDQVVNQAERISDMVRNIATAAEEQSATSDEINTNVTHINDLSREVSVGIQNTNSKIKEVASMAQQLAVQVAKFRD